MFFNPLDEIFLQEDSPLPDLMRWQTFPHKLVQGLVADAEELLCFLESEEYALYVFI